MARWLTLRLHSPLIEPDGRISRIRLSDKDVNSRDRLAFAHGKLRVRSESRNNPNVFVSFTVSFNLGIMSRMAAWAAWPVPRQQITKSSA